MQSHVSVDAMARDYAERAVQTAREFSAQLDYSEQSVLELETILTRLAAGPQSDDVAEICKIWGSYLGEVVRRRFGGDWTIETYPGKQFATLTLNVGGNKLFPTMKVHRRLTQGPDDDVWLFYKMVKARLEAVPGGKIQ
ncbi:MAG TPA: hypothetical protein VI488_01750 [Candidatus Angelobacter sp.]